MTRVKRPHRRDRVAFLMGLTATLGVLLGVLFLAGCSQTRSSPRGSTSSKQGRNLLFATFDVSPDGKTLVFPGMSHGSNDLFLLDLATNKVTQLTSTPGDENYPAFSPDGKSLVYQLNPGPNQPCHLFLRSLDGKSIRQLTSTPATKDEAPRFSPNGEKIVFARSRHLQPQRAGEEAWSGNDVFVIDRNGKHPFQVTHLDNGGMMRPVFYPDNRHVLFEKTNTGGSSPFTMAFSSLMSLARADTNGQESVQEVVKFGTMASYPCVPPNGKEIVFCGNFGGTLDIYRMPLAGGKPYRLLAGEPNTGFCSPVIPSDGKSVYCMKRYSADLYKMNADGSGLHQIADSNLFNDPLHWKLSAK